MTVKGPATGVSDRTSSELAPPPSRLRPRQLTWCSAVLQMLGGQDD